MTLQEAVAIAATLTLAASGILLDRAKIQSDNWRLGFASVVLLTVGAFIASGVRALGASSRTHTWTYPDPDSIFERVTLNADAARVSRAAGLLKAAGQNREIVHLKSEYLTAAARWFRRALVLLALLAAMFVAYAATTTSEGQSCTGETCSGLGLRHAPTSFLWFDRVWEHDDRTLFQRAAFRRGYSWSELTTLYRHHPTVRHVLRLAARNLLPAHQQP